MTKAQIQKLLTAAVQNCEAIQALAADSDHPQVQEVYIKHAAYVEAFVACQKALKGDTIEIKILAKL